MGKAMSVITSPFRYYNIESRAHKVISQSKPVVAPKFKDTVKDLERVLKDHPEIIEQAGKKDSGLDDRLKQVFVTSSHEIEQKRVINPDRPLPTNKQFAGFFELGYLEPETITPGKVTLKQILQFLGDHRLHSDEWTAEKIALEYKLKLEDVKIMLEYYKLFALYVPEKADEKKRKLLKQQDTKNFTQLLKQSTDKITFLPDEPAKPSNKEYPTRSDYKE
ncbi:protein NDUFAF4 homolog [Chironomus tepperi]|uniref:protein NDUFAF4 homolog n=1 Tax=Chironomus tepperi TaxID=113505 RepID=UPI00391EEE19